jgi:hypothetical protein
VLNLVSSLVVLKAQRDGVAGGGLYNGRASNSNGASLMLVSSAVFKFVSFEYESSISLCVGTLSLSCLRLFSLICTLVVFFLCFAWISTRFLLCVVEMSLSSNFAIPLWNGRRYQCFGVYIAEGLYSF